MKIEKIFVGLVAVAMILIGLSVPGAAQQQKTDNFVLLIDQSADMHANYHQKSKNYLARKKVAEPFIDMVPTNIPVQGAIYMYGITGVNQDNMVQCVRPMTAFNRNTFQQAMDLVDKQNGPSSLSVALRKTRQDLQGVSGRTAVIVISGGNHTDVGEPSTEAKALKQAYGDNVCFYTVLVGKSKRGGIYLRELVDKGVCGLATTSDSIATDADMKKFVNDVFFGTSGDGDRDGVPDGQDRCLDTPYGAKVDVRGCWALSAIQFDVGKADIKPQYYNTLDQIASVMNANPGLKITVIGHTDSTGDAASNQTLSEQRAASIKDYLIQADVEAGRLRAIGKGETDPLASNDTSQGRAQNRRIEFKVQK